MHSWARGLYRLLALQTQEHADNSQDVALFRKLILGLLKET